MYKTFSNGLLSSNTYVVYSAGEAIIVDLGNPSRKIVDFVKENNLQVKFLVLTHAHYDHAEFLSEYKAAFPGAKLAAHEREVAVMTDPEANVSIYFGTYRNYGTPDITVREGDVISVGESEYRVLSTPGHTPGSICLYNKSEKLMLTGDTLFAGGRGRCDFKLGSEEDMARSLSRLKAMDADIIFLSGHGGASTIGAEGYFFDPCASSFFQKY